MWRILLAWGLLAVCAGQDDRQLATRLAPNLAQGQPVVLSSIAQYTSQDGTSSFSGDGFRATDGDFNTAFFVGNGCAETQVEPDPWMRVDFGREVPVAVVRLWTRTDSADTGLGPLDIRLGNSILTWRENLACAEEIYLTRDVQPNMFNCLASGRYLYLVLRVRGTRVAPFSICEIEVTPKGPTGNKHILQTAGGMWNLQLQGVALSALDRIRIVPDTVLCGLTGSATMHSSVLVLTSPSGARAHGNYNEETWENIQVNRMGMYKVCWCGGDGGCTIDEHFSMHVATLIINGMMITVGGNGNTPNRTGDMVDGDPGINSPLADPWGIAVSDTRVFFSERSTHMIRYMDIEQGKMYTLAGKFYAGMRGDFQPAYNAELWEPSGLALDKDQKFLYLADFGSHRVRRINLEQTPLNSGIIEPVAGNGFKGRGGDGQPAIEAQLDSPTGVAVDLNQMLWICDSGNDVLRVVSMEIPVRIPGTNEFQRNIILTAAGGATGQTTKGDGGVAWLARMQSPWGVAVSSAFISNEDGTLPVNVYVSEATGHQVRTMSLEFKSYLGVINTLAGTGQRGNYTKEASPLEAPLSQLNTPSGVAADEGLVYVSDSENHRLLMMPALEYVSMGCWRENIESPWIPSIEGQSLPWGISYLSGVPENRPDAITACAMAALRLGYEVFAIRQMGVCATSKDAHLYFRFEGSSTSCSEGKGGARDNSVYRFARTGMMTQQQGLIYVIAGRDGRAGFSGDRGTAWITELRRPNGLGVHPVTKDLYVADSGNQRLRLIFRQVGPNPGHSGKCTNGFPCEVEITGNGLQSQNQLAIMPSTQQCGQSDVIFQLGVGKNPTIEVPSPSFTRKKYNFGPPFVSRTGNYRLCFCVKDAVVFGQITPCSAPEFFIHDAGNVQIVGPDARQDDAEVVEAMPGRPFSLAIFGMELSIFDRVRLVKSSQPCGVPGAEEFAEEVQPREVLEGGRHLGNESFSLWANVTLKASGSFRFCWCQGARPDGSRLTCTRGEDFRVEAARINVRGPIQYAGTIRIGGYEEITVRGGDMAGFSSSDRIRLVDAATVQCGSPEAQSLSPGIDVEGEYLPSGPPHRITADSVTWTNVRVRDERPLRVCWCGAPEGCIRGEDFLINAALIQPLGPHTETPTVQNVANGTTFTYTLRGNGLGFQERIRIVDDYTLCGSRFAGLNSLEVHRAASSPQGAQGTFAQFSGFLIVKPGKYRVCYCYCAASPCCTEGEDFYTEVGAVLVSDAGSLPRTPLVAPVIPPEVRPDTRPPGLWGEIPKDITLQVHVRTLTRNIPFAGSMGPIEVKVFQTWPEVVNMTSFTLVDLVAGQQQSFMQPLLLNAPMTPTGIIVSSQSTDAWYGQWIEVEIEGLGVHRFAMDGWTAFPADRQARRITQGLRDPPLLPTMLPAPEVELWESHAYVLEPCGGCPPGFECKEEEAKMVDRLHREAQLGLVYDDTGGVSDPAAAKRTVFRAVCRPICGDGVAQPGEQCDDGNLRSMDGCNGVCEVEQGFECANFASLPSSCWPRQCYGQTGSNWQGRKAGNFPVYGADEFAQMSSLGATCAVETPLEFKAPPDWPKVCYKWRATETFPPVGVTNDMGLCPRDKTNETLRKFVFAPPDFATVDCQSYEMEYVGSGVQCNSTRSWQPPAVKFASYDDCARFCEKDKDCLGVMFWVDQPEGGQKCSADNSLTCTAHCQLVDDCAETMPVPAGEQAVSDQYHVGRKVQKSASALAAGPAICTQVVQPKPVFAYFSGGVIIIQFDSMVEPPTGVSLNQDFYCSHLLWATSQVAVGGRGAACRWVSYNVLQLRLGPEAVVARFESYDTQGWLTGDTRELFFDRSKLHPRGMDQEMFSSEIPVPVAVSGRMHHPLETGLIGMPEVPQVIIRGPYDMGGCGDLEVVADTSAFSGGRRWKSVVWECLETRPDGSLPQETQDRLYSACINQIAPLLTSKPWCGLDFQEKNVAQTCELRVVIPSSAWCGLSLVSLGVTLTRADGYKAHGSWTTNILPLTRIPAAGAVGSSEVFVQPQRLQGDLVGRLRLEVSSESDAQMIGRCTCNLTRAPNPDGSESRVVVDWYYGEVKNGMAPRLFEMSKIFADESASANVLEIQLRGELMKPNSHWLFYARVAYAVYGEDEGSYVPFNVTVGPLLGPMAHINGPYRVNNDQCSFTLDASGSRAREIMYSLETLGRRLEEEERRLQNSSIDVNSGLQYGWRVRQLAAGRDDQKDPPTVPSAVLEILELEKSRSSQLTVPQALLPEGLFVFTVEVYDALYPSLVANASTTVLLDKKEYMPVITAEGPKGVIGPRDSVEATFIQTCIVQTTDTDIERTHAVILMRGILGQPRSFMRAYKELTYTTKLRDVGGGVSNSLWVYSSADRADLQAGFIYSYRLLTSTVPKEAHIMSDYKERLLASGDNSQGAFRDIGVEPMDDPESISVLTVDTEPFGLEWGPFAGTLDVLNPVGRIGIAMKDVFRLQQAWATDKPPLEYTFYYGEVPEEKRAEFMAELGNFEMDILTDQRVSALVPENAMVPLSDWSQSPTLALPLKEGMYVFEGRARDATGLEAKKYVVAWSHPAYQERVVTSYDRVTHLETYMRQSRQAILQVRAFNRGSVSVVPVCAAVFALPSMYDYDFMSMVEWNAASPLPMPNLTQPIYGAPIVSRETRNEVIEYLLDIMRVLMDIIYALEPDSLGADTRRLQEQYWQDTTSNLSTPLHMEVVAGALAHLSANLAPIGEPELFVFLGTLTSGLVERVRGSRGDIRKAGNAPQDLVKTLSFLLASIRPIDKPREGVLRPNITEHVQARLSAEIIRTAVALGDVMAAIADPGGPPTAIKQAMPQGDAYMNSVDGDLVVTIIKKKLIDIIVDGVQTQPDYQSMQRWIYPQITIDGLGPPGNDGASWAGDATVLFNEAAKQCQEAQEDFLQTITMTTISWPVSPFLYATGTQIGMNINVTVPYTVQMRSCGQPVVIQGVSGKIRLTFRLSPDVVRDRRWGYGDDPPYRVVWWEDRESISTQAERVRRWIIAGCKTFWSRTQEDIVTAECDRLPSSQGSVLAVELVPRPIYEVQGAPSRNRNVHNVISYLMVCFLIRWTILLVWAYKADVTFWPSEKQLMKLLYLPWERKWRERLRRGRLPPPEPITWNPLLNDFWFQTKMLWIERFIALFCAIKALRGSELFYSVEVRELIKMRSGDRDVTYERFVDSMNDKDQHEKIQYVKEQRSLAAVDVPRKAAWQDKGSVEAFQDQEATYRNEQSTARSGRSGSHGPSTTRDLYLDGPPLSQLRSASKSNEEQRHIQELALRTGDASGQGPVVPAQGLEQLDAQEKAEAALEAALYTNKVGGLPPGWEEYVSEEHGGRIFFVFSQTGDTTWERPTLLPDGTVQFFPTEDSSPTGSKLPPAPDLRGKGKLGSLRKAAMTLQPDGEAAMPMAARRSEGMHGACPGSDEEPENEWMPMEREREVPASRRLPLQREALHGAPEAEPAKAVTQEDDGEDEVRAAVMASLEAAKNSQEVTLPAGWEMQTTPDGGEFYVNLRSNLTQWQVPKLPAHWEERFSRKGEVYYLSLFDGRTQWDWPQENAAAFERRLEEAPGPSRMLALPGSTQEFHQENPVAVPDDVSSQASDESSLGIALDEVDANELLAVPPGTEVEMTPREGGQDQQQLTKWGADERDAEWISLKRQMAGQKKAHDERWLTARHFPGVREFVRKYELANQVNNWDRAVDNVTLKIDNAERQRGQLGAVAELRKEELRQIFPIIQRLQWTKWSGVEIFMHCVIREYPLQNALRNTARPTKFHRTLLHIFRVIASLVGACIAVEFEAPVNEEVEATSTATWDLFIQAITMPITGNTILCAFLGMLFSSIVKRLVLRLFYRYAIPYNQRPTTSVEARKYQLRYWHELAEMGKWTCIIGSFLGFGSALAMCMLAPQPRAGVVFQAFWFALIGTHWLLPLLRGGANALLLISARSQATFDGWLTVWPAFMNFEYVGVKTTEFMVWRAQRIVAEEELLLQVYPDMPSIGRKFRDADEEEEIAGAQDPNYRLSVQTGEVQMPNQ